MQKYVKTEIAFASADPKVRRNGTTMLYLRRK